jgi:hypothetical protein
MSFYQFPLSNILIFVITWTGIWSRSALVLHFSYLEIDSYVDILWRACNLTAFIHSLTGPVGHPFASHHEGPGFNPQEGTLVTPTWLIIVALSGAGFVPNHHYAVMPTFTVDLTQLSYLTDIVSCWGGALWRAYNLIAFIHILTGPVGHQLASRHEGPEFNPQGGTYVKPGFSC